MGGMSDDWALRNWQPEWLTNHGLFEKSLSFHCPLGYHGFLRRFWGIKAFRIPGFLSGFSVLEQSCGPQKIRRVWSFFQSIFVVSMPHKFPHMKEALPQWLKLLSLLRSEPALDLQLGANNCASPTLPFQQEIVHLPKYHFRCSCTPCYF